eukprot:scaffold96358_cov19-Tisochrysis_lutea.AAC.2
MTPQASKRGSTGSVSAGEEQEEIEEQQEQEWQRQKQQMKLQQQQQEQWEQQQEKERQQQDTTQLHQVDEVRMGFTNLGYWQAPCTDQEKNWVFLSCWAGSM